MHTLLAYLNSVHFEPACWCLPPFVRTARTQMCAPVKDPIYICLKRVGLTAGGIET